jgi:hypothetical protein
MYQVTRLVPSAVTNSSFSLVSEFSTLRPTLCVIREGTGLNHGAKEQIPHVDEVGGGTDAGVPFVGDANDSPCAATAAASTPSIVCRYCSNKIDNKSGQILFSFGFMRDSQASLESGSAMCVGLGLCRVAVV